MLYLQQAPTKGDDMNAEPNISNQEPTEETCEHGLALWLCAGPSHYPREF